MNAAQMLVVEDVHTYFGGGIHALRGVSLAVDEGEIVALIGSNGAGKTTLLNTICGLLRPRAGRIKFADEDISRVPTHAIVGRGIALEPEGRRVFATLTVRENLLLGAYSRPDGAAVRRTLSEVLEYFPRLAERLKQAAGTLSGGEQQMLAIGPGAHGHTALAHAGRAVAGLESDPGTDDLPDRAPDQRHGDGHFTGRAECARGLRPANRGIRARERDNCTSRPGGRFTRR